MRVGDPDKPMDRSTRRAARRWLPWLSASAAALVLAAVLAPEGRLACDEPELVERSPDGTWTLTLCRRPVLLAMPGQGGDVPGWIVLRDAHGAIRGVVSLGMVSAYGVGGMSTEWLGGRVVVPLTAELPLRPAHGPVSRWLADRAWRLRAHLGLAPTDDEFR